jgi:glycosyltransferase involved in cell wall biosynthesis
LRALDYPAEKLELVVTSDASTDRTEELAERSGARVIRNTRGGKVAAQNNAVRSTAGEIVAFSDANCTWAPDALRRLVRNFADPQVAYVCGRLNIQGDDGRNKEGVYWRYELALRADESRLGSVTGGNGSIYAVRRGDYVEVDSRFGHDLSFPYLMVQRGKRAVYEPSADAYEKATPTNEDEYRRKVRMFEHCWAIVAEGKMLRRLRPLYLVEVISHRHLRYASGLLHLVLLGSSIALVGHGVLYAVALGIQLGVPRRLLVGLPRYYVLANNSIVSPGTTRAAVFPPRGTSRRGRGEQRRRSVGAEAARRGEAAAVVDVLGAAAECGGSHARDRRGHRHVQPAAARGRRVAARARRARGRVRGRAAARVRG